MVSTVISCACPGETFRFWKRKHIAANQLVSRAGDVLYSAIVSGSGSSRIVMEEVRMASVMKKQKCTITDRLNFFGCYKKNVL